MMRTTNETALIGSRKAVALLLLGAAGLFLPGHSPYLQWYAYRAKHLVVVTDDARPGAFAVAAAVASAVAARWPESKAVPAAARTSTEVVKLLRSGQLQVGLLPAAAAVDAFEGRGTFSGEAKVPLRAVAVLGGDLLVVLEGYAKERARLIAEAVAGSGQGGPLAARPQAPIPFHPGALEYYQGRKGG
jgi:TRAP-type uncharacterized transport system substrate-binding protein